MNNSLIEQVESRVKVVLASSRGSHDLDHTMRVRKLTLHIGRVEGADLLVVEVAALLHDIGRGEEDRSKGAVSHEEIGAEMAGKILEELAETGVFGIDEVFIEKVCHCILAHRFRGRVTPASLEAKVLFDADKLDSIGAVGIGRTFLFAGEIGAKLHNTPGVDVLETEEYSVEDTGYREFMVKLRHIAGRMLTEEGRRLAKERHEFMLEFFERLKREVEGEI